MRRSLWGTINSAFPKFKQRNSSGNTQTMGLLRSSSPGKWMATSAVNFLHFSDRHPAHVMIPSFRRGVTTQPILSRATVASRVNRMVDGVCDEVHIQLTVEVITQQVTRETVLFQTGASCAIIAATPEPSGQLSPTGRFTVSAKLLAVRRNL